MQNIKFKKAIKDVKHKEKSEYKKSTFQGIEKWKSHIKKNPNDYHKFNDFFDENNKKNPKKFSRKNIFSKVNQGKNKRNFRDEPQRKRSKKGKANRPGKVTRMKIRNQKNIFSKVNQGKKIKEILEMNLKEKEVKKGKPIDQEK